MSFNLEKKPSEICVPIDLTHLLYQSHTGKVKDQNYSNKVYDQTLQGQATLKFKNGNLYEGDLNQGYMDGNGTLKCFNGIVYQGNFKLNEIRGKGVYTWPDGSYYEGDLQKGLRQGFGKYTSPNQEVIYEGDWENGLRHGKGKISFMNGQMFEGNFSKGYKHGKGKMTYESGNFYDGEWKFDKKDGYGIMNWNTTQEKYYGEWKNNLQNGEGVHIWLDQKGEGKELRNRYEGAFLNGQRNGYGTFYYANGSKYEGEWKNNKKNGYGIFTEESGDILQGTFKQDKFIKPKPRFDENTPQSKRTAKTQVKKKVLERPQSSTNVQKKTVKYKKDEEDAEKLKQQEIQLKEERKKKMEIQMNPYSSIIDIADITECCSDNKLEIHTDLVQVLLRNHSTLKSLYKTFQLKYENTIGENAFCMDLKSFWQFCKEVKILDSSLTLASVNRLFFQGAKNKFEVSQSQENIEKKIEMAKDFQRKNQKISNRELSNFNMIDMLSKIQNSGLQNIYEVDDKMFQKMQNSALLDENQSNSNNNNQMSQSKIQVKLSARSDQNNQKKLFDLHDGKRPILHRHFIDLLIRTAHLKYTDVDNLGKNVEKLVFEKIFPALEKQKSKQQSQTGSNQNNSSSNQSNVKASSVNISFLEDTEYAGKYRKAQEFYQKDIQFIFDSISTDNKSEKYGYKDRTCRVKIFYKLLINAGYIVEINDKHIIFHMIEKYYDPSSLIAALDQQLKQADRNKENKKGKQSNAQIKLKKEVDKQKQLKLIIMLNSELIQYEMSELLVNFLCRKDKDMSHTKNEELFRKKLGNHVQKIVNFVKQQNQIKPSKNTSFRKVQSIQKQPLIWPTTEKDVLKTELAKERVIKNRIALEAQQEREQKLREAKERLKMEKEDVNVPEQNEEDYEDFDESEIEVYDDDYLANF